MLYLTRKIGESVIINNTIELTVVEVKGRTVKLGFNFPPEATILRKELHDKIMQQNIEAAGAISEDELLDALGALGGNDDKTPPEGQNGR